MGGDGSNNVWYIFERVFLAASVILGIALTKEKQKKIWYSFWFVFPAIVLLFYWKNIPEYYFGVSFAVLPLLLAFIAKKYKVIVISYLIVGSVIQINRVWHQETWVSLNDKKAIVAFMSEYTKDKNFNFSYDVPFGEEIGYPYLFKWMKHEPENIPEARLYTLSRKPTATENVVYSKKGLSIIQR